MKIKINVRFASSIGSSKNLWTYQGFFLVAFKFYTFGSWFNYNHWVGVCYFNTFGSRFIYKRWVGVVYQKKIRILAFLGKYSNIVCWVSKCVVGVRIIWYQSLGSKIRFIILLSFVSCYHPILFHVYVYYSLFLFWVVHQV